MPDIASDAAPAPAGPVRHLSTATDPDTGLVTDTYVKPLGTTTPGEVRNTRPWGEVGLLERPSANASIVIVRVAFDIVHPDTLVPYPLDRVYNHHLVVHSRDDETDESELRRAVSEVLPELIPADVLPSAATLERIPRGGAICAAIRAAVRRARGHSSLLSPCGVGVGVAGAGAEWRGQQVNVTAAFTDDPYLNGTSLWVEPPGTTWGVNAHLIDLRDVENLADAVQCNCEAYARRTPGTPQNWDHGPLPGGGVQCCGDGALAPLAPARRPRGPDRVRRPVGYPVQRHVVSEHPRGARQRSEAYPNPRGKGADANHAHGQLKPRGGRRGVRGGIQRARVRRGPAGGG